MKLFLDSMTNWWLSFEYFLHFHQNSFDCDTKTRVYVSDDFPMRSVRLAFQFAAWYSVEIILIRLYRFERNEKMSKIWSNWHPGWHLQK